MANTIEIVVLIDRFDELIARLPQIADEAAGRVADSLAKDAQGRAPRKTGYMADHISVGRSGTASYDVTAEADYSHFVENGTRYMAARPFMLPAAMAAANDLERIFVAAGKALL